MPKARKYKFRASAVVRKIMICSEVIWRVTEFKYGYILLLFMCGGT